MTEVITEMAGATLLVTLNRPDRLNALTFDMHRLIAEAIDRANRDDAIRAVLFTGAGRGFCAGTDLGSGFSRISGDTGEADSTNGPPPRDKGGELVLRLFDCRKPLIAAVNGAAAGMGAALTLAMDHRIGTANAKYIFPYVRRGIVPESCSSWFLPRLVGVARALDWLQTGRSVDAAEAAEAGLLREIVGADALIATGLALADRIAEGTSPLAVALARQMVWQGMVAQHPMDAHRHESQGLVIMARSGDPREGAHAFMEKRAPAFGGKVSAARSGPFPGWEEPPYAPSL
ncbi:enoyl-CoA hydratase-related protein [Sphingobium sp. HBC34]|uniref:Enoyl-CoA hydratase-related protein n=1 Tax=Sphingobium cyanobacteriorum TaxID=3063954 RepID=A0ABT8ZR87_9SPHN|nr:enoyl-CoA hydratase-related protein [Sphingobium sp. HBC34]MDO7836707.1 enoyl-CoA hydratase-related protein [Sphingobium sp. HBC34]